MAINPSFPYFCKQLRAGPLKGRREKKPASVKIKIGKHEKNQSYPLACTSGNVHLL